MKPRKHVSPKASRVWEVQWALNSQGQRSGALGRRYLKGPDVHPFTDEFMPYCDAFITWDGRRATPVLPGSNANYIEPVATDRSTQTQITSGLASFPWWGSSNSNSDSKIEIPRLTTYSYGERTGTAQHYCTVFHIHAMPAPVTEQPTEQLSLFQRLGLAAQPVTESSVWHRIVPQAHAYCSSAQQERY